jgi:MmyB-like transcription regulator ligand binding domain
MDNQAEVRAFLGSRRARLTPDQTAMIGGGRRRVPGLRREEVAMLAGMSTDYARMERGHLAGSRTPEPTVRPSLQRLLDAIIGAPAWVMNSRADILATNPLGRALLAPMLQDPANGHNNARFVFLGPASRTFLPGLGAGRGQRRGGHAHGGRTEPPRQGPHRSDRRARHPQ